MVVQVQVPPAAAGEDVEGGAAGYREVVDVCRGGGGGEGRGGGWLAVVVVVAAVVAVAVVAEVVGDRL